jgi:hypothetical protein
VSFSLFAALALGWGGRSGNARGIVLISRSVLRRNWERTLVLVGEGEVVLWSREEESQDCWTGEAACSCEGAAGVGMGVLWGFEGALLPFCARAWASHASRVLWSTGQAAAGSSCEDIVAVGCVVIL